MPKTIDSLQIEIKASAEQAEKAIDSLISSFTRLSSSMGTVDAKGLTTMSNKLSKSFGNFNLKLSNSTSKTKIMARGFQSMNSSMTRSHGIISRLTSSFGKLNSESKKSDDVFTRLASTIGMLYMKFFWLKRVVTGLWSSIKDSMDYIETLNYFDASFDQVAKNAVSNWKEAGYDSAQAYYDSFADRAKELTNKMTGWQINDDNTLTRSGYASLGLNPTETMQYQAQFAQMASSMGVASETALKLSNALTMIGADLASVKNLEFADVWKDMASGMVGMSRTLDKYGVNIRNANMQTKLAELGIDATVSSLSQADKAMLRTIILLDSTRYAWADLSETLNSPANQLRVLTSNFKMLCQMIGGLFLPLVQKVLPYINAMVVALQRLVSVIANFFGIDLSKITSSVSDGGDAMSDILDDADGLDDALDDASNSAKKLKNNLLGVDELNIISENQDDSVLGGLSNSDLLGDALDGILDEYQNAWDEAFKKLEDRVKELADKICEFFKKLIQPISDAWKKVGQDVVDAWKKAFSAIGDLLQSIGRDFWRVWEEPNTTKIFENLFNVLKDAGLIVEALAKNFKKAWDENERGYQILRNIRDICLGWSTSVKEVADYAVQIAQNLDFAPLLDSIVNLTGAIAVNSEDIFGIVGDLQKRIIDFGQYLIEDFLPRLLNILADVIGRIDWEELRKNLNIVWTALERIAEVLGGWLLDGLERVGDWIVEFINGGFIKRFAEELDELATKLENSKSLGETLNAIFDFGDFAVESIVDACDYIVKKIGEFLDYLNTVDPNTGETPLKTIGKRIAGLINTAVESWDAKGSAQTLSKLIKSVEDLISTILSRVDWVDVGRKIGEFLANLDWQSILLKAVKILLQAFGACLEIWMGSFLEAPFSTALLSTIAGLTLSSHAIKLVTKLATALTGQSCLTLIGNAFSKLFSKGVTEGATKGLAEAGTTVAKTSASSGGLLGSSALGTAISTGVAVVATAGIGESIGKYFGKDIFGDEGGFYESWTNSFENIKEMWSGVAYFFKQAWDEDEKANDGCWKEIGKDILLGIGGGILATLATILYIPMTIFNWFCDSIKSIFGIASPAKNVMYLGEYIMLGIIEGFLSKLTAWIDGLKKFFETLSQWFNDYVINPVKEFFSNAWESITNWSSKIIDTLVSWKNSTIDTIVSWATESYEKFTNWISDTKRAISDWVTDVCESVKTWYDNTKQTISEWYTTTVDTLKKWYTDATNAIKNWFEETKTKFSDFKDTVINHISEWYSQTKTRIDDWKDKVVSKFEEFKTDAISQIKEWISETVRHFEEWKETVKTTVSNWVRDTKNHFDEWRRNVETLIDGWKKTVKDKFDSWSSEVIGVIRSWSTDIVDKFEQWKNTVISKVVQWYTETKNKITSWIAEVKEGFKGWKDKVIEHFGEFATQTFSKVKKWYEDTKTKIDDFIEKTKTNFETWKDKVIGAFENLRKNAVDKCKSMVEGCKQWFESHHWDFDGIKTGLGNAFDKALSWCKQKWQSMQTWFSSLDVNVSTSWDLMTGRSYNTYATGGFPEDGWFRASHGELIGQFDNGQSVVANNNQIVEGIQGGVERAVSNVLAPLLAEIANNTEKSANKSQSVVIDGREIVKAYDSRSTRNGFSFT